MVLSAGFLAVLCFLTFTTSPYVSAALAVQAQQNASQGSNPACPCSQSGISQNRLESMQATLDTLTMAMSNVKTHLQTHDQSVQAVKYIQRNLSMLRADLHGLANNVSKLNTDMKTMKKDVDDLQKDVIHNEKASDEEHFSWRGMIVNVSSLQTSLEAHGAGLSSVSNSMTALSNALNLMSTMTNILNGKVDKVEQRVDVLTESRESSLLDLSQAVDRLEANVSSLTFVAAVDTSQVAFSVHFTADPAPSADSQGRYLFNSVTTNIGKGYNPATGEFSAPVGGLYVFFLKIMSVNNQGYVRASIMTSAGERLGDVWAEGKTDHYDQGSVLVTAHLGKGGKVWAKYHSGASRIRGDQWSVFSGFLIQATPV